MMFTLTKLEHKIPPPVWALFYGAIMAMVAMSVPLISWQTQLSHVIAALLIAVGVAIDIYSIVGFIKARTTINPLSPGASTLVVDGLYRWSRNPMYLGAVVILAGWGVYLAALSALLILPLFVVTINRLQIRPEERKLQQIFGREYIDYCQRVSRWL